MEAVGGLASLKNASIVEVASCCSIKLISYLQSWMEGVETSLADTVSTAAQLEADTPLARAKAVNPKIKCTSD